MIVKNRMMRIALVSLIVGIVFSYRVQGMGPADWSILALFVLFGFVAGAVQAFAIVKARQGRMSKMRRNVIVILSFVVLVALKGILAASVASHLANSGDSSYVQIFFSIFGIFFARGAVTAAIDKAPAHRLD
ncbi:hypothetical protein [Paenibacillus humicola]|uniref:hypothetical protein n=1 Tax=Paenibacillus humicola TaxID=3110540 RepID=UPI00237BC62E|nr:hypothetical protein [Paenibacillus humicola]